MTKRLIAIVLVLILCVGCTPTFAKTGSLSKMKITEAGSDAQSKMTKTDTRITAYLEYLREVFDDEIDITHVGIVDINKDTLPELFYVMRGEDGSEYGLCGYADNEVFEYEVEDGYLGYKPSGLSLIRYSKTGTSTHCWLLRATTTKKNEENRYERFVYQLTRSGETINADLYFYRSWKSGKKNLQYFIDGVETIKSIYEAEKDDFFYDWQEAATTKYKSQAEIRKVTKQTWAKIKSALSSAATAWKWLPPVTL